MKTTITEKQQFKVNNQKWKLTILRNQKIKRYNGYKEINVKLKIRIGISINKA